MSVLLCPSPCTWPFRTTLLPGSCGVTMRTGMRENEWGFSPAGHCGGVSFWAGQDLRYPTWYRKAVFELTIIVPAKSIGVRQGCIPGGPVTPMNIGGNLEGSWEMTIQQDGSFTTTNTGTMAVGQRFTFKDPGENEAGTYIQLAAQSVSRNDGLYCMLVSYTDLDAAADVTWELIASNTDGGITWQSSGFGFTAYSNTGEQVRMDCSATFSLRLEDSVPESEVRSWMYYTNRETDVLTGYSTLCTSHHNASGSLLPRGGLWTMPQDEYIPNWPASVPGLVDPGYYAVEGGITRETEYRVVLITYNPIVVGATIRARPLWKRRSHAQTGFIDDWTVGEWGDPFPGDWFTVSISEAGENYGQWVTAPSEDDTQTVLDRWEFEGEVVP